MLRQLQSIVTGRRKKGQPAYRRIQTPPPARIVLTDASLHAMRECIMPEIIAGHEGIAYLLGQTNGVTTVIVGAIRPESRTTRGSFNVSSVAMAHIVRKATDAGLQVAGQIHSHPEDAFHSGGDEDGARIAYAGYVSIVVPEYGRHLPDLVGAAMYFYRDHIFEELRMSAIRITNGKF